LIYFNLNR